MEPVDVVDTGAGDGHDSDVDWIANSDTGAEEGGGDDSPASDGDADGESPWPPVAELHKRALANGYSVWYGRRRLGYVRGWSHGEQAVMQCTCVLHTRCRSAVVHAGALESDDVLLEWLAKAVHRGSGNARISE